MTTLKTTENKNQSPLQIHAYFVGGPTWITAVESTKAETTKGYKAEYFENQLFCLKLGRKTNSDCFEEKYI